MGDDFECAKRMSKRVYSPYITRELLEERLLPVERSITDLVVANHRLKVQQAIDRVAETLVLDEEGIGSSILKDSSVPIQWACGPWVKFKDLLPSHEVVTWLIDQSGYSHGLRIWNGTAYDLIHSPLEAPYRVARINYYADSNE